MRQACHESAGRAPSGGTTVTAMTLHPPGPRARLPAYVPGKSIPGVIKLASNEVNAAPTPPVLAAIARGRRGGQPLSRPGRHRADRPAGRGDQGRRVPGSRSAAARSACASSWCQATCREPTDEVVFAWRSFEAYPIVTQIGGATARPVPLDAEFRHDVDAMAAAVGPHTRLVMVCSPNNPTGTVVTRDELERLLAAVPAGRAGRAGRGLLRVRHRPGRRERGGAAGRLPQPGRAAHLLEGLPAGRAAGRATRSGSPEVATALRKVCSPFSVNSMAQAAAIAALDDADNLLAGCAGVITERIRVRDALVAAGFTVPPTQSNFVWLALGEQHRSRSPRTAWSTRSWSGRSTPTGCGSPSRRPPRTTSSWPPPSGSRQVVLTRQRRSGRHLAVQWSYEHLPAAARLVVEPGPRRRPARTRWWSRTSGNWSVAAHLGTFVTAWFALGLVAPLVVLLVKGGSSPFDPPARGASR